MVVRRCLIYTRRVFIITDILTTSMYFHPAIGGGMTISILIAPAVCSGADSESAPLPFSACAR